VITTGRDWADVIGKSAKLKHLVDDVIEICDDWKTLEARAREIQPRPVVFILTVNELLRFFMSVDSRTLSQFQFCIHDADEHIIDMDLILGFLRKNSDLCSK
jgi:hypothetical protein